MDYVSIINKFLSNNSDPQPGRKIWVATRTSHYPKNKFGVLDRNPGSVTDPGRQPKTC